MLDESRGNPFGTVEDEKTEDEGDDDDDDDDTGDKVDTDDDDDCKFVSDLEANDIFLAGNFGRDEEEETPDESNEDEDGGEVPDNVEEMEEMAEMIGAEMEFTESCMKRLTLWNSDFPVTIFIFMLLKQKRRGLIAIMNAINARLLLASLFFLDASPDTAKQKKKYGVME
ncbi:hypothetical protein SK128_026837 [Halocaridina rubra]|uniref:Uncharacterized protein n=1 Tax=Halocaridina rubra TaxID=373956 RepID=A0AAN8X1J6_HALRR